MQFKDSLKELRRKKGLTQQALADKIFVSRSAVAKWEKGLGFPNETSYNALLDFFETTRDGLPLDAKEEVFDRSENASEKVFWDIVKENIFIIAVSVIAVVIYFIQIHRYSYSMTAFVSIESLVFIAGTVVTSVLDKSVKSKKGFLTLLLPVIASVSIQIIIGLAVEI